MLEQFRVFVFAWGGERGKATWGGLRNVFGVEASVGERYVTLTKTSWFWQNFVKHCIVIAYLSQIHDAASKLYENLNFDRICLTIICKCEWEKNLEELCTYVCIYLFLLLHMLQCVLWQAKKNAHGWRVEPKSPFPYFAPWYEDVCVASFECIMNSHKIGTEIWLSSLIHIQIHSRIFFILFSSWWERVWQSY